MWGSHMGLLDIFRRGEPRCRDHDYLMIGSNNECKWLDDSGNVSKYVQITFYRCRNCGHRHASGNNDAESHGMAPVYMERWKLAGVLPPDTALDMGVIYGARSALLLERRVAAKVKS